MDLNRDGQISRTEFVRSCTKCELLCKILTTAADKEQLKVATRAAAKSPKIKDVSKEKAQPNGNHIRKKSTRASRKKRAQKQ